VLGNHAPRVVKVAQTDLLLGNEQVGLVVVAVVRRAIDGQEVGRVGLLVLEDAGFVSGLASL